MDSKLASAAQSKQLVNREIPRDVKLVLDEMVERLQALLSTQLVGVYLHGSLAMGSFNPASSDIDVLIVSEDSISSEHKRAIQKLLLELSPKAPGKGFEISVVTLPNLKDFKYPTPYEFHFGTDHLNKYETGYIDEGTNGPDPDLAGHFVMVRERGICLYGQPILNVFPRVTNEYYLRSIAQDSECSYENISRGAHQGLGPVPVYAVLNFCRVMAFIKDGLVLSKKEGGEWGLENLSSEFHPLINEALTEYQESGASRPVDLHLLQRFADYSITIIRNCRNGTTTMN